MAMRTFLSRTVLGLVALTLAASGCAEKINGPGQTARVNVVADLKAGPATIFGLTVTGPDMATQTAAMEAGDDRLSAQLSVPIGPARMFVLRALDRSGVVLYRGSAQADVTPLLPVNLTIAMEPVAPLIYLNPHFSRVAIGSEFTITINVNDLPGTTAASLDLSLFGLSSGQKLWQAATIDKLMMAPEQVARGSQLSFENGSDAVYLTIQNDQPIVDENGDGALVIIHCRTWDTWSTEPIDIEPVMALYSLRGYDGPLSDVHIDTARYRLRRERVPESYLGGIYNDVGVALLNAGAGAAILAVSGGTGWEDPDDLYLTRLDANGVPTWESPHLPWLSYETTTGLAAATGGGYYACGASYYQSGAVVRLDAAGNQLWRVNTGGDMYGSPLAIAARRGGGCVVVGSWANDGLHYYLAAFNGDGQSASYRPTDFSVDHEYRAVVALDDNTFVAAGYAQPHSATGNATLDKLTFDGEFALQWSRTYGAAGDETASDVIVLPDGGFLLVGSTSTSRGGLNDLLVVRTDREGAALWQRQFGRPYEDEIGAGVCEAVDGGFVAVGTTSRGVESNRDIYLVKFDGAGNPIWENVLGGPYDDLARDILATGDGYLVAGSSSQNPEGDTDILLVKVGSNGGKIAD